MSLDMAALGSLLLAGHHPPSSQMVSGISSPGSPTLTHASSGPDDTMDLFDFAAFEDSPLNAPVLTPEQSMAMFGDNAQLSELYAQYFGTEQKPLSSSALDASVINPLLLAPKEAPQPLQAISEESPIDPEHDEGSDMSDQDMDDYVDAKPTTRSSKKTPTAAKERKVQPRRKAKSTVADLALPLPASAALTAPALTSTDRDAQGHLPHIVFPVPDYADRPPPDEYARLSSKEKRQLRNKISARNFRHRRKEYITTLEGEIATRDTTISALQEEVTTLRTENKTLRTDLDLLKKTVDELLNRARPAEHPPAPKFDARKDRAPSSSWAAGGLGGALPHVNVHTTLVPAPSAAAFAAPPAVTRNMNPLMDGGVQPGAVFHLPGRKEDGSFLGGNPFTLDAPSMDRYRAQLYSSLAANLAHAKQPAPGFRPAFFAPLTSADAEQQVRAAAARQTALVASHAASALARGLAASFWRTFTGANPHSVADLLAGRAELQIVPAAAAAREGADDLAAGMQALSVQPPPPQQRSSLFGGRKS